MKYRSVSVRGGESEGERRGLGRRFRRDSSDASPFSSALFFFFFPISSSSSPHQRLRAHDNADPARVQDAPEPREHRLHELIPPF